MSTQLAPRPAPSSRPVSTRPSPSRRTHYSTRPRIPFRWDIDTDLDEVSAATTRQRMSQSHCAYTPPSLPEAGPWAATIARAIVEVSCGARPAQQLQRWLLPDLYTRVATLHCDSPACVARPVHWRTCAPSASAVEAAVIVSGGGRIFVAALRLEEYRGRWMVTALDLA